MESVQSYFTQNGLPSQFHHPRSAFGITKIKGAIINAWTKGFRREKNMSRKEMTVVEGYTLYCDDMDLNYTPNGYAIAVEGE